MSYFSPSSEFDLPHPTLARHQPRFYIPDRVPHSPGPSSSYAADSLSVHSRHPSGFTAPSPTPSGPSTPFRVGSRASLAALRHALHTYHVASEPRTPQHQMSRAPSGPGGRGGGGTGTTLPAILPPLLGHGGSTMMRTSTSMGGTSVDYETEDDEYGPYPVEWRYAGEPMDALVDIHRVLYRGYENVDLPDTMQWAKQGQEVKRVVERWFEGDCVYDHPLLRLSSRQAVLTHFALLHLMSTAYLPSLTPSSVLLHVRSITARLRGTLLGGDDIQSTDVEAAQDKRVVALDARDEWKASEGHEGGLHGPSDETHPDSPGWWKLWDVSAECLDIGCMECYGGNHLALIEHVISLTLFPSVIKPRVPTVTPGLTPTPSSDSLASLEPAASRSFIGSLATCVLREFDYLLHWDLPISTFVEFNEVGKATHVRDVVDVRDAIETFVPFAKRFNWITRRVAGLVTSTVGSIALSLVPGHSVVVGHPMRIVSTEKQVITEPLSKPILESAVGLTPIVPESQIALALPEHRESYSARLVERVEQMELAEQVSEATNVLGLEGVPSMAPDIDSESPEV